MTLLAVPFRHRKGPFSPFHIQLPENQPPTGALMNCSPSLYLNDDLLDWLSYKHWDFLGEPQLPGHAARVFIRFYDADDAMMFKLTWGGA